MPFGLPPKTGAVVEPEFPVATRKLGDEAPLLFLLLVTDEVATGLVVLQERLEVQLEAPEVMVQSEAESVPDMTGAGFTVTATQEAEQLLPSLDSPMVPSVMDPLLSAQTRTYQVPDDGNVYEEDVPADPDAASGPILAEV